MSQTPVMTCEEAIRSLAAYLDGELDPVDRGEVERHIAICRSCYSRREFERRLREQLAGLGREPVRPEFRARVRSLLGRFDDRDENRRRESPNGDRHLR